MDWTVCSRETERDYTWDNTHASHLLPEYAQGHFSPAFEGSLTTSRVATLFRCHGVLSGVVLGVSVDTLRKDFRNRPIRTMAFLRAENDDEAKLLAAFFSECLRKSDAETIYKAESDIAKAVESLYQTKKLDDFMQFCRSLPTVNGGGVKLADRWAIRRDKTAPRSALVESLPALIADNKPFLLALTDRLPTDVLGSLGSMFDRAVVRIFSKAITTDEKLPEPASQKHRRAAAIGGTALLVLLVAAIGTFFRGGRNCEANPRGGGPDGGSGMSTNREYIVEMVVSAFTKVIKELTPKTAQTNVLQSSQHDSGDPVTSAITNAPPHEVAVTNSIKAATTKTGKRKTENE